ncbi:carbohydrate-binding protein [Dyadobacter tibetensis]|uniref:carbohydrate-binding protein n=1 Tax=Dyadobacter tibetensis TaxID=1211851 RepID=UPI0004718ACE|nr:carbohydrate-binding protein [Dyadobacter tibetensis]
MKKNITVTLLWLLGAICWVAPLSAQDFIHPGIWHKRSDLDRMKHMVKANKDPWKSSFDQLVLDSKSSYTYQVQKNPSNNSLSRENPCDQCSQFESDARAAYLNSLMWYITEDQRHADKAIEILMAWSNLTNFYGGGTEPLSAGIYTSHLLNAAEIIRYTEAGWKQADIEKFENMLVYPGYSTTTVPTAAIANDQVTFYWRIYAGDPARHGNQDIIPMKSVMAMGIFMNNRTMYERGLRYISGLPHLEGDLPYAGGPPVNNFISSNEYYDEYNRSMPANPTIPEDYGYNGVLTNYIYENGQCQEASRDQSHTSLGIGTFAEAGEIAWNQGDNFYGLSDNRILLGSEYTLRYNTSYLKAYPDQPTPWEPTVESGEFIQVRDRTGRWFSKKINPYVGTDYTRWTRGNPLSHPSWEMLSAHYASRMELPEESVKWTVRSRDLAIETFGYETSGFKLDAPGWGALTYRRPALSPGDPIAMVAGQRTYGIPKLPGVIQAENFDFMLTGGEGKTFHDLTTINTGGQYRPDEAVDIAACNEGGFQVTSLEAGEWINYTVAVPTPGRYNINLRYASVMSGGGVRFEVDGVDKTGVVIVPHGASYSTGADDWKDMVVVEQLTLQAGVHSLRMFIAGVSQAFSLNHIDVVFHSALQEQTIEFAPIPSKSVGAADFDPGATASSGLTVLYTSSNQGVATIVNNQIHIVGAGVTTITALQAGNDHYQAAIAQKQDLVVSGISAGDYLSSGDMSWNGGVWNIADGNGGISGTTTSAPNTSVNVHILPGHTVTLSGSATTINTLTVEQGATLLQQSALTVSGNTIIKGQHTMSNTLSVNDFSIESTGVLESTTVAAGSVMSLNLNKSITLKIAGRLGAPKDSPANTVGSGIRIFVSGAGTTTFTGPGVCNIARLAPTGNNTTSQTIVVDMDMELRNSAGTGVASLSLQNGNVGSSVKEFVLNEGKTLSLNSYNDSGALHGGYGTVYGRTVANSSGGQMIYNIHGTMDCRNAQFNLYTNQKSANNEVIVNVTGTLLLGQTIRFYRFMNGQKLAVNIADGAMVAAIDRPLQQIFELSGQSVNSSNFTGTPASSSDLGGVTLNGFNPNIGTYSFTGSGGAGYLTPPYIIFEGGTLNNNSFPTFAIGNLTDGVVTSITVVSTGNYSKAPTYLTFVGGGAPTQGFSIVGEEKTGSFKMLAEAGKKTPFWLNDGELQNPVWVDPAVTTVFDIKVSKGNVTATEWSNPSLFINRTWDITPETISATNLTFGFNQSDANPGFKSDFPLRLNHFNKLTTQWETVGTATTAQTGAGTDYQVSFSGITNFSPFALANDESVLPVTLQSFRVTEIKTEINSTVAELSWKTSEEISSERFVVQRSYNGKSWESIGSVLAMGNTATGQDYSFEDNFPLVGESLYRLKMIDLNGEFAFSTIRNFRNSNQIRAQVYPNPASDRVRIESPDWDKVVALELLDLKGNSVRRPQKLVLPVLKLDNIQPGLYFIKLNYKDKAPEIHKIVIE